MKSNIVKNIIGLLVLGVLVYAMRSMIDLVLMTFLFSYIFYRSERIMRQKFKGLSDRKAKILQLVLFFLVVAGIVYMGINFIPEIIKEVTQMSTELVNFYNKPTDSEIINFCKEVLDKVYFSLFSQKGVNYITKLVSGISKWSFDLFLSLILSLCFMLGKDSILNFTKKFQQSKAAVIYEQIEFFGKKFVSSFGKVIEVQILIAIVNALLSTLGLILIGFPNVIGFGVIIFILGMIPVAGVLISLVPLCIVAFNINGMVSVIYILVMIALLHAMEAYVLNPKLMASKTKLPVFYTLVILIVSEHFFGIWGLIVGIPTFMFIIELLEVPIVRSK